MTYGGTPDGKIGGEIGGEIGGKIGGEIGGGSSSLPLLAAAIAAVLYLAPAPALASSHDGGTRTWVASLEDMVDRMGTALMAPFRDDGIDMAAAPMAMERFRDTEGRESDRFWHHLEEAGYKMKEVKAEVGLIPGLEIQFLLVRELSEADRNSLERKLEIDEKKNPGMLASIKRRIVRTLLEASDFDEMRIEELEISLLPLPSAEFVLAPVEAPLGEEHDQLYRSLQELQHRTEMLQRALGVKEGKISRE